MTDVPGGQTRDLGESRPGGQLSVRTKRQSGSQRRPGLRVLYREPVPGSAAARGDWPKSRGLTTLAFTALFAISLAVVAIGYLLDIGGFRLAGVLGALFFGVGTAPLQLSQRPGLAMRLGVAGVAGLSVPLLGGVVMVLTPLWHPLVAGLIIGAGAAGVHVQACRRRLPELRAQGISWSLHYGWRAAFDGSIACAVVGTVLWWGAALEAGHIVPGVGGFLTRISPLWYAGLVILLAGIVLARGKSEAHAMFPLVSLVAAVTLTPALTYGTPRAQSAAKHVALAQLILQAHHLNPGASIYDAYSGFFAGVAWICSLAGVQPSLGLAAYWPFLIGLIGLAELRFFFGRLISSSYRISVGMTLVVLVNAIGADYFSPQSVGFVLGLGIYGLVLGRDWPGLDDRWRIALLVLAGCALAVTHELSPYITGGVLVVLVIFRLVRPWWVPATCLLPAIVWALVNWQDVARFGLIAVEQIGNLSNYAPPKTVATPGLQRLPIVNESAHALLLGLLVLIALAGVGFVHIMLARPGLRRLAWALVISAGMGLIIITFNAYGNEGIFRASLFGIPWLAAIAVIGFPGNPPRWASAVFGVVAVGLLGTFLIAMFGLDNASVIRPADFQALQAYESRTPARTFILDLSYGDLPNNVAFSQSGHTVGWTSVVPPASVGAGRPDAADVRALTRRYLAYAVADGGSASDLYAIWSPAAAEYSVDYGLETLAHAQKWRMLLAASPDWQVVFHSDGTYVFHLVVPARARP